MVVNRPSAPVVAAHIHQAPAGVNGQVVVPLFPVSEVKVTYNTTIFSGTSPAYPTFIDEANAGLLYVNLHTSANSPGEVRGQIS